MNVFNKVTLQTMKKNRMRTLVTIIGIIISVSMICAVTTLSSSMKNYALKYTIHEEGDWHGSFSNITWQDYKNVSESDKLAGSTYGQHLGHAKVDSKVLTRPFLEVVGGQKDSFFHTLSIRATSGRLPKNSNEILLPENLASEGGVKYKIGDTINLDLGEPTVDFKTNAPAVEVRESRTYTVVGFYKCPRFLTYGTQVSYKALTVADTEPMDSAMYDMYFKMNKVSEVYDFMESYGFESNTNWEVLRLSGVTRDDVFMKAWWGMEGVIMAVIMLGSIALIYNAFSISVSERTKQFGLLASVGATKKQLKKMVLFEALAVSAVGIPLGIGAGIAGISVTLKLIGGKLSAAFGSAEIPMNICVSWKSVVTAVVIGLFTVLLSAWIPSKRATKVSAIDAIRQSADIKAKNKQVKTSKLTYKLFGLPGVLAHKHYKRNKRKYRATVISLVMSIVLFVSAAAYSNYLAEISKAEFDLLKYDIGASVSAAELKNITPEELLSRVRAAKSVTKAAYTTSVSGVTSTNPENLTEAGRKFIDSRDVHTAVTFVDDAAFKAMLKEHGFSEKAFMNPDSPRGILLDGTPIFNMETQKEEKVILFKSKNPQFEMTEKRNVPGYFFDAVVTDENGNQVLRYVKDARFDVDGPEELFLPLEEGYVKTTLQAGAVIREVPYFADTNADVQLIYPMSAAKKLFDDFDADGNRYNYMICSDDHAESCTSVKNIWADCGFDCNQVIDLAENVQTGRNVVLIIKVFSYGFISLISLIAAANVFNTISTNISLRRREFAMLKSVGMTQKGFNGMMNFECLLYGSKALLYGLPVSAVVAYFLYRECNQADMELTFHLPWTAIGIAVLSVFLVVFVTMLYSMSKIKKDNPIDALKNENL